MFKICQDYDMLLKNEIRKIYIFMLKILDELLIATVIISLISIKAFPLAMGHYIYLLFSNLTE